ncbi:class I SAM-dependent DNA methyltransferase [Ruminococcus flavefaciens]|uniref:type I restriction-modification system subunit M n=1 Tax=Ruminococcus flavefaciens TaxID=1265 RepID=UPI0026E93E3C|nr:class I SAM-dependent DNA methyltransferase [Ruminococcus flavefaciens]
MANDRFTVVGTNIAEKAQMIWNVADMLRGPFKPHEYGLVILPMTVVKRFHDCLLPTHDAVLKEYESKKNFAVIEGFLTKASGYQFYNTSKYTFNLLCADPDNIEANFRDYLAGFSANVQDVLAKFDFNAIINRMVESNTLYLVIKEFNSQKGYLGPDKINAVDCGYMFEDLVKRFSESFGEEAGAHFTSRDVIYLMTDLLLSDADLSQGGNVTVYDMAMGTSQMLSCMEERIHDLNSDMDVTCFGQEFNPSTFAIAKADMMIRGGDPNNMRYGDTLSEDQFSGYQFQYIISNPPFGIDWKREQKAVEAEAKKGELGRFAPGLPKISDGQQLFVLNGLSKLAQNGKMAIVQNGSPLFSGDAGSGPSEIRRYILENDWLDAIIQLSTDMFMNTGISTYIWVLSKNKPAYRAGKVQLIDASHCGEQRRKSIGFKRYDVTDLCRELIVKAYGEFRNDEIYGDKNGVYCHSRIFDNEEFGYNKIVVERPTRYKYTITRDAIEHVINLINEHRSAPKYESMHSLVGEALSLMSILDSDNPDTVRDDTDKLLYEGAVALTEMEGKEFMSLSELENAFDNSKHITDKKKRSWKYFEKLTGISAFMRSVCPEAEIYHDSKGKPVADASKRDTENVPLMEDIDEYFVREVLPYAPDAWIDTKKTKVGYEIPMTRYFYEYQAPEKVEDIMSRLHGIEADIQASLDALFGGEKA